jgi:hypothetical protein
VEVPGLTSYRYSPKCRMKLSEKWFEQRFSSEFGRYMNTRWTKISTMDDPQDLAISALGTFQTVSGLDFIHQAA